MYFLYFHILFSADSLFTGKQVPFAEPYMFKTLSRLFSSLFPYRNLLPTIRIRYDMIELYRGAFRENIATTLFFGCKRERLPVELLFLGDFWLPNSMIASALKRKIGSSLLTYGFQYNKFWLFSCDSFNLFPSSCQFFCIFYPILPILLFVDKIL